MNLGDFRTRIAGKIGLSNKAGSSEQTLVDGWVNEARIEFLRQTKCYVRPFNMALTAGEGDYDLPSNLLALKSLYLIPTDGRQVPELEPVSSGDIIRRRRFTAIGFLPTVYCLEGANLLMLDPVPSSDDDELGGLFVPYPTDDLTDPTHDPSLGDYGGIPREFHPALEAYGSWKAADWDDDTSSQVGLSYKAEWEVGVRDAKLSLSRKAGVRWAAARPKRSRPYLPITPGTDTGR